MTRGRPLGWGAILGAGLALGATLLVAQSALGQVGATETDAEHAFTQAVIGFGAPGAASRPFLALAPAARGGEVTALVGWAKTYAASPAFARTWADMRAHAKPTAPVQSASADADLAAQAATQQKQIDDVKKSLASLPADQQAALQKMLDQMQAQIAPQQQDPKYQALMKQSAEGHRADEQKQYQDALATWNHDYPADPKLVIARRLQGFLALSADVKFDAALATKGKLKVFVDPVLEAKSTAWKLCFRAGREATQAARAAAQAWLKELGQ